MVSYNLGDLEFILRQIEIAEAHAAGTPLTQLVTEPLLPWGLRTVDGTFNNIIDGRETWGAADQDFLRLLDAQFRPAGVLPIDPDGPGPQQAGDQTSYEQTSGVVWDGQPRTISNLIVDQTPNNPAAVYAALKAAGFETADAQVAAVRILEAYAAIKDPATALARAQAAEDAARAELQSALALQGFASELDPFYLTTANAYTSAAAQIDIAKAAIAQVQSVLAGLAAELGVQGTLISSDHATAMSAAIAEASSAVTAAIAARTALNPAGVDFVLDADLAAAQAMVTAANQLLSILNNLNANNPIGSTTVAGDVTRFETAVTRADTANTQILALEQQIDLSGAIAQSNAAELGDASDAVAEAQAALAEAEANNLDQTAATAAAQAALEVAIADYGLEITQTGTLVIPNIAPDEGISAPFNSWMTLFGQFFDHGLDLVNKGGNGIVIIPLQPGDPNFVPGSPTNFMVLTRATNQTDANGNPIREHNNQTTPFVDQNQTYTSHASHQVFLREYELDATGKPVSTGHLLEGSSGSLATWADVKAQAASMLGIQLVDADVLSIPLLRTDPYGKFIPGPNGYPQIVVGIGPDGIPNTDDDLVVEGDPSANGGLGVLLDGTDGNGQTYAAVRIGHAFLDDIAHAAVPVGDLDGNPTTPGQGPLTADADSAVGGSLDPVTPGQYDNELLDRHFITGDGRGNENIGLTAVHHVFHSEHNRMAEHTKDVVIQTGSLAFVNEWLLTAITQAELDAIRAQTGQAQADAIDALNWNGERLFQAARFGTEMQYQHLVFEEFARKVNPMVDLFVFNPTMDINPAIFAEFAHVVYRFGHSMLTETVARTGAGGQSGDPDTAALTDLSLIDAFLNPVAFDADGTVAGDVGAGAIVRGMTQQRGNEIDEFVVDALRNFLVGLPLDLAALNIARGRDAGVPSLNVARAEFYEMTKSEWLKPYTSWTDFAQNLKTPASIINFIAAYGTHTSITSATTLEAKRIAASELVMGVDLDGDNSVPADRLDFLNAQGAYAGNSLGGLNDVDLWIGGLAEKIMPFGGMLGSTFTFVFEAQLQNLQNGDRFYYLSRTQGTHFLTELENNAFSKIIMANTDMSEEGNHAHLPGEIFARVDHILEVDQTLQLQPDPVGDDPVLEALQPKVARNLHLTVDGNTYDNSLVFQGGEHVVLGGTNQNDVLIGDLGDDTIWGDGGNDYIVGDHGINRLHGGSGDDIIYGGGDPEFLHGDAGNDAIHGGNGLGDLIFGGVGHDFVIGGEDGKEVFAAEGNDFILGSKDVDFLLGGEGDDWMEGGEGFDTLAGENSELFFNSPIIGHDVMFAGANENDFDAESGDDIMVQGESVMRNEGMFGFDWVSFEEHETFGANADMRIKIFTTVAADILRNRFDKVEAMSGSALNDKLIGDDRITPGAFDPLEAGVGVAEATLQDDGLTREGVERIKGLQQVLGLTDAQLAALAPTDTVFDRGNILLGGDGSDVIEGGGGDDIIDGDKWLNVRIGIKDANGNEIGTTEKMQGAVHFYTAAEATALGVGYAAAAPALLAREGAPLDTLVFDRTINPGDLAIVREILNSSDDPNGTSVNGNVGDFDTAVFRGNLADYSVTNNADGTVTVVHTAALAGGGGGGGGAVVDEGTDVLRNIERIQFADDSIDLVGGLNQDPNGSASLQALQDDAGNLLFQAGLPVRIAVDPTGALIGVTDPDNVATDGAIRNFTVSWQIETAPGSGLFADALATGNIYTPSADPLIGLDGERVRAVITYTDGNGVQESIATTPSGPLAPAASLVATGGDDVLAGTHRIPDIPANQGFGIALPQLGNDGTLADPIDGGLGDDEIHGLSGDDVLSGGALGEGSDILDGGRGNDTVVFGFDLANATLLASPSGTVEVTIGAEEDEVIDVETLAFTDQTITAAQADTLAGIVRGTAAGQTLTGTAADETFVGAGGNDIVNAGAGSDSIIWNVGDGRDVVNGGGAAADVDTLFINGDETLTETFRIYTRAAAIDAGLNPGAAANEIVITRTVNGAPDGNADRIALVRNIEELEINVRPITGATVARGDNVEIFGDFTQTSLALNTITINGSSGDDTVDISALNSAHRIVFHANGGNDTLLGNLRPQDVIQLSAGTPAELFTESTSNGQTTRTFADGSSITFTSGLSPTFVGGVGAVELHPALGDGFSFTAGDLAGLSALVNGLPVAQGDDEVPTGVRDLEGTGNNLANPDFGSADQPFIRLTDAHYGAPDANGNMSVNPIFAGLDPRTISNVLGTQDANLPTNAAGANIFFMAFGQYFDHGLDFLPKGGYGSIAIGSGADDPADLTRGTLANPDGIAGGATPEHMNKTSPFVDQNQAYGSTELVGQFLRAGDGQGGLGAHLFSGGADPSNPEFRLLPTLRELILEHWENNTVFHHESLPGGQVTFRDYYTADGVPLVDANGTINETLARALNADFMGSGHTLVGDNNQFINILDHYVAGDLRANENYTLTSIHTIWARNHNYHVDKLVAAGFQGSAEELFQAAKIVNEAEYQKVVFNEFADYLIGGMKGSGHHGFDDYNPDVDARISHEFAAAVYRVGHSLIGQTITVLDDNGQPKSVPLFDAFLNPTNEEGAFQLDTGPGGVLTGSAALSGLANYGYVPKEGYEQIGVNNIISGIVTQAAEEVDYTLVDAVRNDLVRIRADLFAFNVARGWDVGLGTLNQVRAGLLASDSPYIQEAIQLSGADLSPYTSWEDFQARNGLSDAVIAQFKQAYPDLVLSTDAEIAAFRAANPDIALVGGNTVKGIDRVDLWVGGLAEPHINDGMVGSTFWVVIHEQLDRLQEGDRFYYLDRVDNFAFYETLEEMSFADIVARNTGLTGLSDDIFEAAALDNTDDGVTSPTETTDPGTTEGGTPADDGTGTDTPAETPNESTGGTEGTSEPTANTGGGVIVGTDDTKALFGGDSSEVITTSDLGTVVMAGAGDDVVEAGAGDDVAFGGAGNDALFGNGGADKIWGEDGDDLMDGGAGDDLLFGGAGADEIDAGDGNDRVWAGDGNDTVHAGAGNDRIDSGNGADTIWGEAGDDIFVFKTAEAADGDTIADFQAGDRIDVTGIGSDLSVVAGNAFTAEGDLIIRSDGAQTFIEGNLDGDTGTAEFQITLVGDHVDTLKNGGLVH